MSRSVQRPPNHGRGYSVRALMSIGGGSGAFVNCGPRPCPEPVEGPPSPRPVAEPVEGLAVAGPWPEPVEGRPGTARCCSIGAATRALATSVSRPIWLCHQPLHAIAPSQKFVYVEL